MGDRATFCPQPHRIRPPTALKSSSEGTQTLLAFYFFGFSLFFPPLRRCAHPPGVAAPCLKGLQSFFFFFEDKRFSDTLLNPFTPRFVVKFPTMTPDLRCCFLSGEISFPVFPFNFLASCAAFSLSPRLRRNRPFHTSPPE